MRVRIEVDVTLADDSKNPSAEAAVFARSIERILSTSPNIRAAKATVKAFVVNPEATFRATTS